jgi:hypothetical protein
MSLLVVALIAPAIAQNAGKQVTAFVNVNVIPMDRERVLKDQTVVVRDGRIAELGPANNVKVPAGTARRKLTLNHARPPKTHTSFRPFSNSLALSLYSRTSLPRELSVSGDRFCLR